MGDSGAAADDVVRDVIAPAEPVQIALRWSAGRRQLRRVVVGVGLVIVLAALEFPVLFIGAKPWAIGLVFVLLIAIPMAGVVVERIEVPDARKNGPFIIVTAGEVRLPEQLAGRGADRIPLAGLRIAAWRSRQFSGSVPPGLSSLSRRENTYLELAGNGLALVLTSDRYPSMAAHLPTRAPHLGLALAPGCTPIEVLTGDLVRAADQLTGRSVPADGDQPAGPS